MNTSWQYKVTNEEIRHQQIASSQIDSDKCYSFAERNKNSQNNGRMRRSSFHSLTL